MEAITKIATMKSGFKTKFGIPRQSNLVPTLESTIIFEKEYRNIDALRGLDGFSHIWIIWGFSAAKRKEWSPTVRPPRLGGNERMGVFATRSPFRPNSLGLSCVQLSGIEHSDTLGPLIHVNGADLMDGTPIYDIKPYIPYVDSHPEAIGGFADTRPNATLQVDIDERWAQLLSPSQQQIIHDLLAQDPRPPYQNDEKRIYGMEYDGLEIKFTVQKGIITVVSIEKTN